MVNHSDTRRTGGTLRVGLIAVALLALSLLSAVFFAHTAHALGLPGVDVNLPTGKLLAPVTDTVNQVTDNLGVPVSVNSTPNTLGAQISLPLPTPSGESQPVQASVNVPLPAVVPAATDAVSQVISPVTEAASPILQTVADSTRPAQSISQPQQTGRTPSVPVVDIESVPAEDSITTTAQSTSAAKAHASIRSASAIKASATGASNTNNESSLLPVAAGFFGSVIPSPASSLIKSLTGVDRGSLPYIISGIIFVLMIGLIMGILYLSNHTQLLSSDRGYLAHIAKNHDLVQLSVLTVAIVGSGMIALCLLITRP